MEIRNFYIHWDEPISIPCQHGALTIGNFDGVHRGHQALLAELVEQARREQGPAVVLTFDPHPLQLLRPNNFPPLLTTMPQRLELLHKHGAEVVLILHTTPEMLQLEARDFFEQVIRDKIQPRVIVPGFNFAFGHNREGTVAKLAEYCREADIHFAQVAQAQYIGEPISSSRIRAALGVGDVRRAKELLGRPYSLSGVVALGQQRGKKLGFPTANLQEIATLLPADGVYAVRVPHREKSWPGAANIGPNPTFGETARKIEVHLIGFQGNLYGQTLQVEFVERLRDTRPFAGVEQLKEQLHRDIEEAQHLCDA